MNNYFLKVSTSSSIAQNQPNREENDNHLEVPSHSSQEFDLSSLMSDPGERTQILEFHSNHCNAIRRDYLHKKTLSTSIQIVSTNKNFWRYASF